MSNERFHVTTRKRQTLRLECSSIELALENPARTYWAARIELTPNMGAPDEVFSMIQAELAERWKAERAEPKPQGGVLAASSAIAGKKGRLHVRLSRIGSKMRVVAAVLPGDETEESKRVLASSSN